MRMIDHPSTRTAARLALPLLALLACSDADTAFPAAPIVPAAAPSLAAILPARGSIDGGTPVTITGTGMGDGSTVWIGGWRAEAHVDYRDPMGALYLRTPSHAAGPVDVVVTNRWGRADTLVAAFTYVPASSFDFNGGWWGFGDAGQDIPILFTVENDRLVSVACDVEAVLTFPTPLVVTDGAFAYARADGVSVSGRMVSESAAVGTINLPPCSATNWVAERWPR